MAVILMNPNVAEMNTVLSIKQGNELILPDIFAGDDVRFADDLVSYFVQRFTRSGDLVFDPFAGFGTTLFVARKLGRIGYGIEFLPERAAYIESILDDKSHIICASALDLDGIALPDIDFSFTSPPYMSKNDHEEYPLAAYQKTGADYTQYLLDIQMVYRHLRTKLKPDAYAVIEISNMIHNGSLTTLPWDVAQSICEVMMLEKEIIINWQREDNAVMNDDTSQADRWRKETAIKNDRYGFGYDHSYCLIFKNTFKSKKDNPTPI